MFNFFKRNDNNRLNEIDTELKLIEEFNSKINPLTEKYLSEETSIKIEGARELYAFLKDVQQKENQGIKTGAGDEFFSNIPVVLSEVEEFITLYEKGNSSPEFELKWNSVIEKIESDNLEIALQGEKELNELAIETLTMERNGIKSGASTTILDLFAEQFPDL
jgi:hypothetical protein